MTTATGKSRVLIVDRETTIYNALRSVLTGDGHCVRIAGDGVNALMTFVEWRPELVITELMMTPIDGIELCRRIRAASNVPLIVVSGEDEARFKIQALDAGADDYVVKPFDSGELLARVRAVQRRCAESTLDDADGSIAVGDFTIDFSRRRVFVRENEIRLTPKEFDLFTYLARRPGRVIQSEVLLGATWGRGARECPQYLYVHIRKLREKLEEDPSSPRYLLTEPWFGYRFNPA